MGQILDLVKHGKSSACSSIRSSTRSSALSAPKTFSKNFSALLIAFMSSFSATAFAEAEITITTNAPEVAIAETQQVQRAISRMNGAARWVASTTSMTVMSHEERMKRLGVSMPGIKIAPAPANSTVVSATGNNNLAASGTYYPAAVASSTFPSAYDWRNVNGNSFVTEVKNQGSCGSCWAFASTAVLEAKSLMALNTPNVNLNLAEQVLLSCSGAGSCNGGSLDGPAGFLAKSGNPGEAAFPYTGKDTACSVAAAGWQNNAFKISNWQYVYSKYAGQGGKLSVEMIKNALYNNGPLVAAFNVYSDFYSYRSGVYSVTSTQYQGRHAVAIVGWDDAVQAFIVKNSWGTGWGENGYFRVAYNQLDGGASRMEFGQEIISYGSATAPSATCIYALSQNSQTATSAAMTGSVDVTVKGTGSCAWKAESSATWIKVIGGLTGSGNGKVSYEVAANTSAASRTGTIMVGGQTYTITQAAANKPLPVCTIAASATAVKAGTPVEISAKCSPAATSYTWSNTGFASSVASGKVSPSKTTTYSVKGINAAGSSEVASVTVAVATEPPPSCKLAASQTSVVPGTAVTLTATCSPQAKSYTWTHTSFAASAASGKVTPTTTTTYTVSGTNANGAGNVASVKVEVVAAPTPSCSLTASSNAINAGGSATLAVKCVPAATSYVWKNANFAPTASGGTVKPTSNTTYSVSGVNASGTGVAATTTITVNNPAPLAPTELTAPVGKITTATPSFTWRASANASQYTVMVKGKTNTMTAKMTAATAGCANGNGVCTLKSPTTLTNNETYTWSVVASNSVGNSPASSVKTFQVAMPTPTFPAGDYEAGAISNNAKAKQICPAVCTSKGLKWNGNWTTKVAGKVSVCGCSK